MNEQDVITTVRHHLDRGLEQLSPETHQKLQQIRQKTARVHREKAHTNQVPPRPVWLKPALIALALAIPLGLGALYLQDQYEIGEVAALDSALLSDDLPPEAFTDPGFHEWLADDSGSES